MSACKSERFYCERLRCDMARTSCGLRWQRKKQRAGPSVWNLIAQHSLAGDPCVGCEVGEKNAANMPETAPRAWCRAINQNADPCGSPVGPSSRYCQAHRSAHSRWRGWQAGDFATSRDGVTREVLAVDMEAKTVSVEGLGAVTFRELARWRRTPGEGAA